MCAADATGRIPVMAFSTSNKTFSYGTVPFQQPTICYELQIEKSCVHSYEVLIVEKHQKISPATG